MFSELMWDVVGCENEADKEALEEIENWDNLDWDEIEEEIKNSNEF